MLRLDFLAAWHRAYAHRLHGLVDADLANGREFSGLPDAAECELGVWLARQADVLADYADFARLDAAHRDYHERAANVLTLQRGGVSQDRLQAELDGLMAASQTLIGDIEALEAALARTHAHLPPSAEPSVFWDDALTIGLPVVDQQHRAIARLCDRAVALPETLLSSDSGSAFLSDLYRLLALHFDTEEILMRRLAMPEEACRAHYQEHSRLLESVIGFSERGPDANKQCAIADITGELMRIIAEHVIRYDMTFRHFVAASTALPTAA